MDQAEIPPRVQEIKVNKMKLLFFNSLQSTQKKRSQCDDAVQVSYSLWGQQRQGANLGRSRKASWRRGYFVLSKELVRVSQVETSWKKGHSRVRKHFQLRLRKLWAWRANNSQLSQHEWSVGPMKRKNWTGVEACVVKGLPW